MRKGKARNNGLLPSSLKIISSCLKNVSSNAGTVASTVRSAGSSVAATLSGASVDQRDQVTWAGFDRLDHGPSAFKQVLLIGYHNGFQVLDVEDASNFSELVSKRGSPVTFLQMLPFPTKSDDTEGFRTSHPLLLVVVRDEPNSLNLSQDHSHLGGLGRHGNLESQSGNCVSSSTVVRFYSLRSHNYVHVLRFRSAVCMVRCSPRIVAVGLATQIYCFDALTLENKFSVLTYPVPQLGVQGTVGVNIGYGPMAVGPRWLAYASNNPLLLNTGRLSSQNLTPSPGVSPSTSPGSGSLVARYALESGKQLAAGIVNLGDMGYKTLSKYCQDLIPDGSNSPVSPSSSWKVGRPAATETDNAGIVVIKDFVSRAIISQFKAHTTPISALCFDPSGTLLVTASVHGNSINIFRILPSSTHSGLGTQTYDWSSAHVHLYKLHRGIRAAIIQDICFSHLSQWIAIVSSKGTCHIFILSPFGGDAGFQMLNSQDEAPYLVPVLSLPWWSSSSCIMNHQSFHPPPPATLSVVSRIKDSNSGWLNAVNNVAASAAGKVFAPSGALATVFHNSVAYLPQHDSSRVNSLEHLLVYTPSGHVVQYELLPSIGPEPSEGILRAPKGSFVQMQDEEIRVNVEPVQWWDVCRRLDWPEREISIIETPFNREEVSMIIQDVSGCEDSLTMRIGMGEKGSSKTKPVKLLEQPHWYLSNAEVQISTGRLPLWQKSKICFYTMTSPRVNYAAAGGESKVEIISFQEVELKWKDLLPVFDNFHSIRSSWNDRGCTGGRYPIGSLSEPQHAKDRATEVICHSKPASLSSTESLDGGSSRITENLLDLDQINTEKYLPSTCQTLNGFCLERRETTICESLILNKKSASSLSSHAHRKNVDSHVDNCIINGLSSFGNELPSVGRASVEGLPASTHGIGVPLLSFDQFDSAININAGESTPSNVQNLVDFGQHCGEGCCKTLEVGGCRSLTEKAGNVNITGGHCLRENPEQDVEDEEMLGGIFAFSEEG